MQNFAQTPFVGRSQEIDDISRLLDDPACRLLTLVGPGGIGKTRLAMEVAERKRDAFPDGVYIALLAPLTRPEDMLNTIAEATPFCFQQDSRNPRQQFFEYLQERADKCVLLILDNFEHLLSGVDIVSDILAITTHLKILVTSRETLNLEEEWIRQIAGMNYPDYENGHQLEDYSAVQLFMDRARRIRGDFDLMEDSRSVVEICRLVEGMPLAIELAVGWLKTISPSDIAHELRQNVDILATRSRNLPERHRSIRSVFEHSWRLLSEEERHVLQKLSIFRGGFTRTAAEEVAGASLNTLAGLVDKSLVRLSASGRYDVHELVRQYSMEKVNAAGLTKTFGHAFMEYYLNMLYQLESGIKAHRQVASLNIIAADFENIRIAWQIATQERNYELLSRAVESLHFFGDMRGRYHEVVALMRSAIEQLSGHLDEDQQYCLYRIQARLVRLILLGNMRIEVDLRTQIDVCLNFAQTRRDDPEVGFCLMVSGILAIWEAYREKPYSVARAAALFRESHAVYEQIGDLFYIAESLVWTASCVVDDESKISSQDLLMRCLDIRRSIDDRNGIAWITHNLTEMMLFQLDYVECGRYARESLALMREIRSVKGILQCMLKVAQTTMMKGDLNEARALAEEMRNLAEETSNLDGKMLAAGLLSFLVCVMDENYIEGAALAQKNYTISLEPFFGGHNDLSARWGQALANCGLGRFDEVRQHYHALFWQYYEDPAPATVALVLEAVVRAHEGALESAVEFLGLADHQAAWVNGWLHGWPLLTRLRENLLDQLGADRYEAAWLRGRVADLSSVIRSILHIEQSSSVIIDQSILEPLSDRELEVLGLIADGLSNSEIADRLVLSVGTVKVHTRNIYGKLHVNSRTQALAQAAKLQLL
jgi:predicted ATPase/DNA-binding CsgD family transcriptional regulator